MCVFTYKNNMKYIFNLFRSAARFEKSLRRLTTESHLDRLIPREKDGHLALVSLSNSIYHNLALENYLAETYDLKNRNILLIWISEPSIVFGRHQNPWLECNVREAQLKSINLVRRYSGGGTVYHDLGNLNISFITNRNRYDRKFNLNIIKETLESEKFNLKSDYQVHLSPRHDIFVKHKNQEQSFKITGSAARLSKQFSYHHCTLLFNSNISEISYMLKSSLANHIKTKATPSVSSKCTNMINHTNLTSLTTSDMIRLVCEQFWSKHWSNWSIDTLFNYVNPEDASLVKLFESSLNELHSWEFKFASTPQFELHLTGDLVLIITNGLVKEIRNSNAHDDLLKNQLNKLIDVKFTHTDLVNALLNDVPHDLVNSNLIFKDILNFINKNIS